MEWLSGQKLGCSALIAENLHCSMLWLSICYLSWIWVHSSPLTQHYSSQPSHLLQQHILVLFLWLLLLVAPPTPSVTAQPIPSQLKRMLQLPAFDTPAGAVQLIHPALFPGQSTMLWTLHLGEWELSAFFSPLFSHLLQLWCTGTAPWILISI